MEADVAEIKKIESGKISQTLILRYQALFLQI